MPPPNSRSCYSSSRVRVDRTHSSGARTGARRIGILVDAGPAAAGARPCQAAGRAAQEYLLGTARFLRIARFLRTAPNRRRGQPVSRLPGAFSRFAYLFALRRRPGTADAADGEGLAIASSGPAGIGRRRRRAGAESGNRGAGHSRHRERGGITVAGSVVEFEEWAFGVILLFVAAIAWAMATDAR